MDLSLSELININEFFGTKAIVEHGTQEQKERLISLFYTDTGTKQSWRRLLFQQYTHNEMKLVSYVPGP